MIQGIPLERRTAPQEIAEQPITFAPLKWRNCEETWQLFKKESHGVDIEI